MHMRRTTIAVDKTTRDKLLVYGKMGMSFDDVIKQLISNSKASSYGDTNGTTN